MNTTQSFKRGAEAVEEFEKLLKSHGIEIQAGSDLEGLSLHIFEVFEHHQRPELQDPQRDVRSWLRGVIGMNQVAGLLLSVRGHRDFETEVVPHLRLLNEGAPAQNTPARVTDAASNKIFELVCAAAAMRAGHGVKLEDPKDSGGSEPNPDVIVSTGGGTRWGIACKCLHSTKGQTIVDNVKKGASQVQKSDCDRGVVAINLKNVIRHDRFWRILNEQDFRAGSAEPRFDCWFSADAAAAELMGEISLAMSGFAEEGVLAELAGVWPENSKCIPGLLLYAQTTCGMLIDGSPVPTSLGFFNYRSEAPLQEQDSIFLEELNLGIRGFGV